MTHGIEKSAKTPGFGKIEIVGEFEDWGGLNKGKCASHSLSVYPHELAFSRRGMKPGPSSFGPFEQ